MLSTLWTGTVRAIAVLTAGLAVGVIVTSLYAARAEAGSRPPLLGEVLGETATLQPVQAVQPAPAASYQVPAGALPATRARPLSGRPPASERRVAQPPPARPLVAVLDVGDGGAAEAMKVLGLLIKESLEARGHQVSLVGEGAQPGSSSDAASPLRPDAYVSLRGVAGGPSRQRSIEAWLCKLEGSLSGRLADLVLEGALAGLARPQGSRDGQDDGRVEDPEGFRCDMLLGGRAHMPAVLLELPAAALDGPLAREGVARGVASGIDRFFLGYGASLLQEEHRRGMVWPAFGPVTSHFGPAHPLGIDIGQWQGFIVAATDGIVSFAGGDPCCSYGRFVVIESPEGITTLYAHLESTIVTRGQRVRQGQPLGVVGCTGYCFGNHLHFEVMENGARRDPLSYLP